MPTASEVAGGALRGCLVTLLATVPILLLLALIVWLAA